MASKTIQNAPIPSDELKKLMEEEELLKIPKLNETIKGKVVYASRNEVRLDINGLAIGVIRGGELYHESPEYARLKPGDEVEATVVDLENENGEIELSFRYAGQKKTWDDLREKLHKGTVLSATIIDANKGGLIVKVGHIFGFLPVSQLIADHYPRVPGGDKTKILEHLKPFIGKTVDVKIIDLSEKDEKLIVSEKEAWEEVQHSLVSRYKPHDIVEGKISAITDFGVFMALDGSDGVEGLIHISELAWQRIDHPREVVKIGDHVKTVVLHTDRSKIFLSLKQLKEDPWIHAAERYHVGKNVKGNVLKVNPFGLFVELDPEIHGLAHVSELSSKPSQPISEIAKPGDVLEFKIISMEPREHRLGLSLKAFSEEEKKYETEQQEKKPEPETHPQEEISQDTHPSSDNIPV
jgi:ribosomal protein S1